VKGGDYSRAGVGPALRACHSVGGLAARSAGLLPTRRPCPPEGPGEGVFAKTSSPETSCLAASLCALRGLASALTFPDITVYKLND
jgi:hypothetical protein